MDYKWNVLYKANNLQDILRNVLQWKNISKDKVREFIDFNMKPHDPYLLTNMNKAVNRIKKAIDNNEKICIIGDYDADGVTATSMLYIALRNLQINVIWQVPDRFKDGYGMNNRLIDVANEENCNLIITVDNGIKSHEEVKYANSLGIDVIITDHHQHTENELPTEITIDPDIDDNYPFKGIAGCMVAFKLINALISNLDIIDELTDTTLHEELIEIVTIGTIADVMELSNENRYYVKKGLELLSNPKNIGLKVLMKKLNLYGKELSASDIGFMVGPCINASGRMESPDHAVKLLLCDDEVEAEKYAIKLIKLNDERKKIQRKVLKELKIDENDNFIIKIINDEKCKGILGIIAGNIADKYQKPCFVLGGNEKLSGSGRSVYTYDINSVVQANKDLVSGGGHAAACGIALSKENLDQFKSICDNHFAKWLENATMDDLVPTIDIVNKIKFDLISERLINNINKLKPYGNGNEEPLFISENVNVDSYKIVGKNKNVLQMTLSQGFNTIAAVGFSSIKDKFDELNCPNNIDVVYTIGLNEWPPGCFKPQLMIKDIKLK
ncbi:MAG: single-stranded-DNA-specific exonuclease RecJ [bacterium]